MSTANYISMDNFPLFIWELNNTPEQAVLDEYNMTEDEYIQTAYDDQYDNIRLTIIDLLKKTPLQFHKIEVRSGYYSGLQLYVDDNNDGYGVPTDHDNEACHIVWDTCRSKAIRAYKSEINKVKKLLKKIADLTGLVEIECLGVFSNGEAIYGLVK